MTEQPTTIGDHATTPTAAPASAPGEHPAETAASSHSPTVTLDPNGVTDYSHNIPHFNTADYPADFYFGPSVDKLVDSQVAPLIAAARGYRAFLSASANAVRERAGANDPANQHSRSRTRQINSALRESALVMPWYSARSIQESRSSWAVEATFQLRPASPIATAKRDAFGNRRTMKYLNLDGAKTVVDAHPATPPEWLADPTIPVFFTEGILKGDSLLSAMLLAAGDHVADAISELPDVDGDDPDERFSALQEASLELLRTRILPAVPHDKRLVVLSAIGVANWSKASPSWSTVELKGRDFYIAFDGDMSRNQDVWRQADRLWRYADGRGADVKLLDLNYDVVAGDGAGKVQLGLDDYFGAPRYATLADVLARGVSAQLPPPPQQEDVPGQWRVTADGLRIQECVKSDGDDGPATHWVTRLGFGARVKAYRPTIAPTQHEIERGIHDRDIATTADMVRVDIEFRWTNPASSEDEVAVVTGTGSILEQTPANWTRYCKALIPQNLLMHPEWPPKNKLADGFMAAMKDAAPDDVEDAVAWDTMGWCPGGSAPVFVIGDQVFPIDPDDEGRFRPGVTPQTFPGSNRFGFDDVSDIDARGVVAAIQAVSSVFLGRIPNTPAEMQPIARPEVGAIAMLAGIRIVLPERPHAVLYFYGPPGQGKSYLAGCVFAFVQRYPGAFKEGALPGSAQDTLASTEFTLGRVPIWVMDDVAPKQSARASETQATVIEDLIRLVFNGQAKGRMEIQNGQFQQRPKSMPRALFMLTGEMEPQTPSIRQRTIMLSMDGTALGSHPKALDMMDVLRTNELNIPSKLARLCLDATIWRIREIGWQAYCAELKQARLALEARFAATIGTKSAKRSAGLAADIALGTEALRNVHRQWLADSDDESVRSLVPSLCDELISHVASTMRAAHDSQRESAPGTMLVEAIREALRAGDGYIVDPDRPMAPPLADVSDSFLNTRLGWVNEGQPKPGAVQIGVLRGKDSPSPEELERREAAGVTVDDRVVLLDVSAAFKLASQKYRSLVQSGTSPTSAWTDAWNLGILTENAGFKRVQKGKPKNGAPALKHFAQVMINGARDCYAPIRLTKILGTEDLVDPSMLSSDEG